MPATALLSFCCESPSVRKSPSFDHLGFEIEIKKMEKLDCLFLLSRDEIPEVKHTEEKAGVENASSSGVDKGPEN